jgi:hypothetical protein
MPAPGIEVADRDGRGVPVKNFAFAMVGREQFQNATGEIHVNVKLKQLIEREHAGKARIGIFKIGIGPDLEQGIAYILPAELEIAYRRDVMGHIAIGIEKRTGPQARMYGKTKLIRQSPGERIGGSPGIKDHELICAIDGHGDQHRGCVVDRDHPDLIEQLEWRTGLTARRTCRQPGNAQRSEQKAGTNCAMHAMPPGWRGVRRISAA